MPTYIERYEKTWNLAMTRLNFDEDDRLGLLLENTAMHLYEIANNK
jgi:hypothetical protein